MSVLIAVVALGILIFVHELGHFLVAKRCGIKVERFSLGFGPAIVSKQWGETEYILAWIPLGGYVKMHGDVPEEWMDKPGMSPEGMGRSEDKDAPAPEPIDKSRSYLHKPIPQRIAVAFAGPAFNLIFGYFAILFSLWVMPHPAPVLGWFDADSPAQAAGLQSGDRVTAVAGVPVTYFEDIGEQVRAATGKSVKIEFERAGAAMSLDVPLQHTDGLNEFGEEIRFHSIGAHPGVITRVREIVPGGAADEAGVREGDRIVEINGEPLTNFSHLATVVKNSKGEPVSLVFERGTELLSLTLTPKMVKEKGEDVPKVGVGGTESFLHSVDVGFGYALENSPAEMLRLTLAIPMGLFKLIVGDVPRNQVGGPIEIGAQMANAADQGWGPFLFLLALISINLGILNLLPIPVLDGGHIVFFLVEALNRKPISLRTREIAQQVGLSLLLLLMLFAFYNDIRRRAIPWFLDIFTG